MNVDDPAMLAGSIRPPVRIAISVSGRTKPEPGSGERYAYGDRFWAANPANPPVEAAARPEEQNAAGITRRPSARMRVLERNASCVVNSRWMALALNEKS